MRNSIIDLNSKELLELASKQLAVPGNEPVDLSQMRRMALLSQLNLQLKAVLLQQDFEGFDLDRVFLLLLQFATDLATQRTK